MKNFWKYGVVLGLIPLLSSCAGNSDEPRIRDGIEIKAKVTGANGQDVNIWVFEEEGERIVDSTIVENDQFTLFTDTRELRQYVIEIGRLDQIGSERYNNLIYLFPDEASSTIKIEGEFPGIGNNYRISGDQNSMDYRDYLTYITPFFVERENLGRLYQLTVDKYTRAKYLREMDSISAITRAYAIDYINEKPASPVSRVMLREFGPSSALLGLAKFDSTHLDYFERVSREMKTKYPYSHYPAFIDESIKNILAELEAIGGNSGEKLAEDLAFANPQGEVIALSDLRGQVVLVDFWASWCGPCRAENPEVVETFNQYKDKGFTVFSVSLDTDKNKWIQAIENDNLSWPNHVSDLKGWKSEAATIYGVNSIPATFLIDREGYLIDQNLRGGRLEQRLQEILG